MQMRCMLSTRAEAVQAAQGLVAKPVPGANKTLKQSNESRRLHHRCWVDWAQPKQQTYTKATHMNPPRDHRRQWQRTGVDASEVVNFAGGSAKTMPNIFWAQQQRIHQQPQPQGSPIVTGSTTSASTSTSSSEAAATAPTSDGPVVPVSPLCRFPSLCVRGG